MTNEEILLRVTGIFRDVLDEDNLELSAQTTPSDVVAWDSLANVRLLVAIEGDFGIRFETDELASVVSVGALVALIKEKIARQ